MKVFLITWVLFCVLVIAGLFIAYATDNFPGAPVPQQVKSEVKDDCPPCAENLKRLKEARARWEREHNAEANAVQLYADDVANRVTIHNQGDTIR